KTTITVADDEEQRIFVSADPSTLPTGGGTSVISAVVTDGSGSPLSGIDVRFTTTEGTLQSGGAPLSTNSNGLVTDVLNTSESATVTATTDDGFTGETTILAGVGEIVCHLTVSTNTPSVGETVSFFDTSDNPGNQIERYEWNFGDGASAEGKNVQHVYTAAGTFDVVHSVTDSRDNTSICDPVSIEVSQ
ncbi:MAG: PKD domain-containing protein, partial [Anaerolineae bacterium]|nr:PKD domain-containing protein [Anaerolineae bacterium]